MTSPIKTIGQAILPEFKRVSLSASVTLEAAIVIPLFVFVVIIFAYVMMLLNFQIRVNQALYNTSRTIAKISYAYDGEDLINTAAAGAMLIYEVGTDRIEQMNIVGGTAGFVFGLSDFEGDMVDVVVHYTIELPFGIIGKQYLYCTQRAKTRAFVGVSPNDDKEQAEYVYITPTGEVYHKSQDCTYLKLSIKSVDFTSLAEQRNKSGEVYGECEICADKKNIQTTVYITNYGNRYHFSINCSGLKRGIIRIKVEDAKDYRPCSKCGGEND